MEINYEVKNGLDNEVVDKALNLMKRSYDVHNERVGQWNDIQELFESGFKVTNVSGTKQISSKLIQQVLWKAIGKLKQIDFSLQGTGVTEEMEKLVTAGIATVLDEGKFANCLRDKNGVFFKTLLYGDAFLHIGIDEENHYPIKFQTVSLDDVYVDPYATDIRDATGGLSASEIVVIYRYSMDQFKSLYPDAKVGLGTLPRSIDEFKMLEKTSLQDLNSRDELVEVAHYYNSATKEYVCFAGAACTVIKDLRDEEYPFIKNGKPYIPVLHFKCFFGSEGFYNYGIGHAIYDLATVLGRMDNMAYNHAEDNIYPLTVLTAPKDKSASVLAKIAMAAQQRAAGGKPYVVVEYDATGTNATKVDSLQSQPITQEWERAFTRLEQQVKRLGFVLDDIDRGNSVTATQILAEEEAADMTIKQIGEVNASEYKVVYELAIEFVKEFISNKDKTPLNLSVMIDVETEKGPTQIPAKGYTLGMLSEELKKNHYWVRVNARTGTIPSNVAKQAQIARLLPITPPGSTAWNKLVIQSMHLNDQDMSMKDIMPQAPAQGGEMGEPVPSETDRMQTTMGGGQTLGDNML